MWRNVAYFLDYDTPMIESIAHSRYHNDCNMCCQQLLEDWLSTDHGVKPKTWTTLMTRLEEISHLSMAVKEIKKDLDEHIANYV